MRRETEWFFMPQANTTIAAASTATLIRSLNAAALALRPFTIVREHFFLSLQSDQAVATEDQQVGFGACVVSDQASAIGVTAVPTPLTDLGSDLWMLWTFLQSSLLFSDATGIMQFVGHRRDVDSRAMRKVIDGQDYINVAETPSTSLGLTLTSIGRVLVKLH